MIYWKKLLISVGFCQCAGAFGSIFTTPKISTWYSTLIKPGFNPPNWIFAPVWILLYLLMGISLYIVWQKATERKPFVIFGAQLFLNALWSVIFFGLQLPLFAFIELLTLIAFIAWNIFEFYKIDKQAAYLLFPYMLWCCFAAALNLSILILN